MNIVNLKPNHDAIILKRVFDCSLEEVYSAFASAENIEKWLSPAANIDLCVEQFDFTPGGKYHYLYTLPDGSSAGLTGKFLKINPPRLLSFTWQWEEPDPHAGVESHVSVKFKSIANQTHLTITHTKLSGVDMPDRHGKGWDGALGRLSDLLENKIK